jgi:hypothetical protein
MQGRPSRLLTVFAVGAIGMIAIVGCEAKVYGKPPAVPGAAQLTVVVPQGTAAPLPDAAADRTAAAFDGLQSRTDLATTTASQAGADITVLVMDRSTGQLVSNGNSTPMPIASVAKLFIADDLLLQEAKGETTVTADDRLALDVMLRSSDDNAAENFWNRSGGDDIITRVATRYGLKSTTTPYDGHWWNTMSTAGDLAHYYDMLMNGGGGLPQEQANSILSNLAQSTAIGIDGYPQRFGIPDGLYAEPVAVKQGWMCCWDGDNWMHLSTGVIGADRRFVMVIGTMQPTDDTTARKTITDAVKVMFPGGRI